MAVADNRRRLMPLPEDRLPNRGQALAYPEAVLLTNPVEPELKGEVGSSSLSFWIRILLHQHKPVSFYRSMTSINIRVITKI